MNSIFDNTSKAFSYIFHPLLMPTLGILLMFTSGTYLSYIPFEGVRVIFFIVFCGTFIIPMCFIPLYFYFKIIKSVEMDTPQQRLFPLIITFTAYCCTFYLMRKLPIPFINAFVLACCIVLLLNAFILLKWKISSHLLGLGGLVGLLFAMNLRLNADISAALIVLLLISGLVAASRIRLAAHTPKQVYGGFLLGVFIVSIILIFV